MSDVINFYTTKGQYGPFSNFSRHPIEVDGKSYPTSEHYFQAMKFNDEKNHEEIRNMPKPMLAAKAGRERSRPLREDWESVKHDVMYTALQAKFTQHSDLRSLLLSTGSKTLVEHTTNDSYWGDGGDGSGKNMLGKLLMRLREVLAND